MVVGLKQDLRKGRPTLRLLHLGEPEGTTIGDVCPHALLLPLMITHLLTDHMTGREEGRDDGREGLLRVLRHHW